MQLPSASLKITLAGCGPAWQLDGNCNLCSFGPTGYVYYFDGVSVALWIVTPSPQACAVVAGFHWLTRPRSMPAPAAGGRPGLCAGHH